MASSADILARTGRIVLRSTNESDLAWVTGAEAVPENAFGIIPWTRDEHWRVATDPDGAHWMVESAADGQAVGFVILRGLRTPERAIELKRIVISEKGCGFGRDTLKAAKQVSFTHLGAHRFWLDVFTDNQRAWDLYESEGFVREGILRECFWDGQRFRSLVILSVLESEYGTSDK